MKGLFKFLPVFLVLAPVAVSARDVVSRAARVTNTPTSGYTYNYMYPYLNNQMRQTLNPGDANAQSTNPINAVVKTVPMSNPQTQSRRVVSRMSARSATPANSIISGLGKTDANRSGVARAASAANVRDTNRRVLPRGTGARASRVNTSSGTATVSTSGTLYSSSSRCLADYTECMNSYCERADTEYNRCFCSSKLGQIE